MRKSIGIGLVAVAMGVAGHAASFDCGKALTRVEKLICADVELSKLDENLAAAYSAALKTDGKATPIRKTQVQWIKERNSCADVACIKHAYAEQISSLATTVPSNQVPVEKRSAVLKVNDASNKKICTVVADTLQRISKLSPQSYENPLYVDSIDMGGRSYAYQNVDLDGDGKPDVVEQSCGSPGNGTCTLYVTLSSGAKYAVDDEIFHVMRFESKYYVLVGHPSAIKNHRRRMYALSAKGAELVCKSF